MCIVPVTVQFDWGATTQEVNSILNTIAPALLNSLGTTTNTVSTSNKLDLSDGLDLTDVLALVNGKNSNNVLNLASSLLSGNKKQDDGTELLSSLLSLMK